MIAYSWDLISFALVQVINHGISPGIIGSALSAATKFFELPMEEKMEFASDDITRPVRYGSSLQRSFLKQYSHPLEEWIHMWPSKPTEFRSGVLFFRQDLDQTDRSRHS